MIWFGLACIAVFGWGIVTLGILYMIQQLSGIRQSLDRQASAVARHRRG